MLAKNDNISKIFRLYKNEKCISEKQKIEINYKNLVDKSLNMKNYAKNSFLEHIF